MRQTKNFKIEDNNHPSLSLVVKSKREKINGDIPVWG